METTKQRIRIDYAPLDLSTNIECVTPNSPLTQVYNNTIAEYEPDRTLTPTIILPRVCAYASDGSFKEPTANHLLADMHWYADGNDIATLPDWAGKYEIDQNGSMRGALTIKRNIDVEKKVSLKFKGVISDLRTGTNIEIESDPVLLQTTVKSDDAWSVALGIGQNLHYNPFNDRLSLYDYKVANGIISASTTLQNEANVIGNFVSAKIGKVKST